MEYQAVMPIGIVNPISPGGGHPDVSETEMPAGIIYPINPAMERSDLAGAGGKHPGRRCRQASSIPLAEGGHPDVPRDRDADRHHLSD